MPEGDGGQQGGQQQGAQQGGSAGQQGQQGQGSQQAPWERNGEQFDPQRAWNLIQNLTSERDGFKTERDGFRTKLDEHDQAAMTDLEKVTRRAETAEGLVPQLESDNLRLKVALETGLALDDVDRLRGSTFDELKADAEKFKERFGAQPRQQQFAHGARQSSGVQSMNDLIFGARGR